MAIWFECKVRYDKMQENGMVKKVNEPYLVDALTFTEAESRIIEEMKPYISHVGSAEHGIADGVYEHVGIAMPEQSLFMLDEYATHP